MYRLLLFTLLAVCTVPSIAAAAAAPATQQRTCTFANGRGMRIQFAAEPYDLNDGRIWTPGDQPAALFLDTSVTIEGVVLPVGAYGVYLLPRKEHWTLIVSKSTKPATEYDSKGDIVRATMGSGDLGHKVDRPKIALVHVSPTQCNIRVYAGSTMAWEEVKQK